MMDLIPTTDFKLLFESTPGLYLILLPDLQIAGVNNAYLSATMTKREEIIGRHLFDVFPDNPDDPEADGVSSLRASLNTVLRDKKAHTMAVQKYDIQNPDGTFEERYWSPLNTPVFNEQKEVAYIIHRVENVTDFIQFQQEQTKKDKLTDDLLARTRQMEVEIEIYKSSQEVRKINVDLEKKVLEKTKDLSNSEERFRNTLDKMMEGVQIIGFDWSYLYVNDSVAIHGQYTKDQLIGHTMPELYTGIEQSDMFKVLEKCMKERLTHHMENEFTYSDQTKGWFELSIQPVPEGIFILSIDITERKKAESEIRLLNESLEKKVTERTKELEKANKEILDNNGQLEAVNKELNAFTYSVSHDLRAPLRAVGGYAKMLEEDYGTLMDKEGERLLNVIQYNAKKMGLLIDDLLAFSRLGKKELQKTNVNMKNLAEEALLEVSKSMIHHAIVKIENLHPCQGDYALLKQVFINLISNGIKYSSKIKNPVVEIKSMHTEDEEIYSVKDNGVGFDMQYVNKLFGVFQRLHKAEEFDGTGVGLAIVQRIIQKHGGKIWAEAAIEKGATFYFSLPIQKSNGKLSI